MSYIYVLPTKDYVKFGVTNDPIQRLEWHQADLSQDLTYSKIWKCSEDKYRKIESIAKIYLSDLPQKTRERIFADEEVVINAVLKAVEFYDAEIQETSLNSLLFEKGLELKPSFVPENEFILFTRAQVRMAFAALEWTLDDAAKHLTIDRSTLFRLTSSDEYFSKARKLTKNRIKKGLEEHGVEFVSNYGVNLKPNPPSR